MKKILGIVIIISCLLILGTTGIAASTLNTRSSTLEQQGVNNLVSIIQSPSFPIQTPGNPVPLYKANAGGPYSGDSGDGITFYGSSCYLSASYEWDFGDPNDPTLGYGKHPTHSYSQPGIYYATLTITKSNGEVFMDITPVYVDQEGDQLHPHGGCVYEAEVDEPILFDGSQSSSNGADIVEWIWHFGDGNVGYGEQVTHSYEQEKVYLVTLEVKDSDGNKRQDVLHADIGCTYSSEWDFFANTEGIVGDILDLLSNGLPGYLICDLFHIKMYTYYDDGVNQAERLIEIDSFYDFPLSIDVNQDGDDDVLVNNFEFFKPVISNSPFNNFPWFAFETTLSDIELTYDSDITTDDDFTICLQFSLQIIGDFLGLEEPIVRVGYYSAAGEEKPNDFKVTQIFRPYLLLRLLYGGDNQQQNMNTISYPLEASSNNMQSSQQQQNMQQQTIQQSGTGTGGQPQPLNYGDGGSNPAPTGVTGDISIEEEELEGQQYNGNSNPEESWAIITENGVRVESSDVDRFSLIASFSNAADTTRTTLKITFDSFTTSTLMHRKGETYGGVEFQGANDNSALTLSVTRESQYGTATIGIIVDPIQNFGFQIDIYRKPNDARHIEFKIDNPPENIILFKESEDTQGEEDKHYFYLRNLPTSIDLEWLPHLYDGYFELTKDYASDELEIGICDDLEDPYMNLYMTNLPTQTTLNWQITLDAPRTITLTSDIQGLTLNAEGKDLTQPNQIVEFHATVNNGLDIKFLWSIPDGYFELQRSTRNIDYEFSLTQETSALDITGNFQGGEDDGFVINFNGLEQGLIEVVNDVALDMTINAENYVTETTLSTDVQIATGGYARIQWDESMNFNVDVAASIGLYDFMLSNPHNHLSAEEIVLSGGTRFGLLLGENNELQLGSTGQVSISNLEGEFNYWSGSIASITTGGSFDILLKPMNKYYEIDTSSSFTLDGFNIGYDQPDGQEYDLILEIDSIEMYSQGTTCLDFSGAKPQFTLDGEDEVDLTNFHLSVGSGTPGDIDFTISNAHVYNAGTIFGEWDESSLYIDAAVDFNWDLVITTLNYGDWEAHGNLEGSASMTAQWADGSGSIELVTDESGLLHSLEIIHDDLTLDLGSFSFDAGTITFEWQKEAAPDHGQFNILNNGVDGSITLCKISYPPNGFELELGTITVSSGNIYMDWSRWTSQKRFHIDNGLNVDMDLLKITWDNDKTVTLGDLDLSPGEFRFTWDKLNKIVTIKNGIQGLGPTCSFEDTTENRTLSVSLLNLVADYSKTTVLKWYEDGGSISGIYIDTDNTQLAQWIQFESIKDDTGRRITLYGLQSDGFYIKKVGGDLQVGGKIYLANHLTFSKLVNGEWKDLDVQWNLDGDGVGYIEFNADSAFNEDLDISAKFKGVDISATFNTPDHLKFGWDVDFDGNGYVSIDTDNESIYEMGFTISKDAYGYTPRWGLYIGAMGLQAEGYELSWQFTNPPWTITQTGYIEPGCINDIWVAWNGQWYDLWNGQGQPRK